MHSIQNCWLINNLRCRVLYFSPALNSFIQPFQGCVVHLPFYPQLCWGLFRLNPIRGILSLMFLN